MCKGASDGASESGGGDGTKKQPEAAQFDDYESFVYEVTIEELDKWLGDTGSSHHIKSTRDGMINVENFPRETRIRQV